MGPNAMRATQIMYNDSIQQTERRELLLNLVRLRYAESPEFLGISSISTQFSFDASASVGGIFGTETGDNTSLATPNAAVGFSQRPTVTFVPRRDSEFAQQLLTPLESETLVYLSNYGWTMDRILRIAVKTVNDLKNGATREFPKGNDTQDLAQFARVAKIIGALSKNDILKFALEDQTKKLSGPLKREDIDSEDFIAAEKEGFQLKYNEEKQAYFLTGTNRIMVLSLKNDSFDDPRIVEMKNLLNLESSLNKYRILTQTDDTPKDSLAIETRSMLGILAYLSRGVDVPESHLHLVGGEKKEENIKAVQMIFRDLFQIKSEKTQPDNAMVSVPFRGYWFYIDDEDLSSKRTLGLLSYLIKLKINAGGTQNLPVLTLPVGN
jgi:hypothetical protein